MKTLLFQSISLISVAGISLAISLPIFNKFYNQKSNLPNFEMSADNFSNLTYSYSNPPAMNLYNTFDDNKPDDYDGVVSYYVAQNIIGNRLSIQNNRLFLADGLNAGNYQFKLVAKASATYKYNAKQSKQYVGNFFVSKANMSVSITSSNWSNNMSIPSSSSRDGYLTLSPVPEDYTNPTYWNVVTINASVAGFLDLVQAGEHAALVHWYPHAPVGIYTYVISGSLSNTFNYNSAQALFEGTIEVTA